MRTRAGPLFMVTPLSQAAAGRVARPTGRHGLVRWQQEEARRVGGRARDEQTAAAAAHGLAPDPEVGRAVRRRAAAAAAQRGDIACCCCHALRRLGIGGGGEPGAARQGRKARGGERRAQGTGAPPQVQGEPRARAWRAQGARQRAPRRVRDAARARLRCSCFLGRRDGRAPPRCRAFADGDAAIVRAPRRWSSWSTWSRWPTSTATSSRTIWKRARAAARKGNERGGVCVCPGPQQRAAAGPCGVIVCARAWIGGRGAGAMARSKLGAVCLQWLHV